MCCRRFIDRGWSIEFSDKLLNLLLLSLPKGEGGLGGPSSLRDFSYSFHAVKACNIRKFFYSILSLGGGRIYKGGDSIFVFQTASKVW